ncbi:unnamed protein product [Callosobruchus maculatus]|uniref:Uncharacterized protein n=1 Tax=Callosobruchus maculatus TaxID=64391 RepID=A0A653D7U7_CALMS|nr:unnamed protein product [Callosobruchus maculatus]
MWLSKDFLYLNFALQCEQFKSLKLDDAPGCFEICLLKSCCLTVLKSHCEHPYILIGTDVLK